MNQHPEASAHPPICAFLPTELHADERGSLIALQALKDVPFEFKRVYFIFSVGDGIRRGGHAHRQERQVLVCLNGHCRIQLNDGRHSERHLLDTPLRGALIDAAIWREIYDFSPDCILLVLSDSEYDDNDYIRDYDDYLAFVRAGRPVAG